MSKVIKGYNYKKVDFGSENAVDTSKFEELNAALGRKGDLGITDTGGSYRVVFYSELLFILKEAKFVKILLGPNMIAIKPVSSDTPGAYEIKKGGIIYSTELAGTIMSLNSDIEFKSNATTRCGRILEVQTDEEGNPIVVISFA